MVGVGVFGLPFAFAKAGFWIGAAFLIPIALETLLIDTMLGEVILRTTEKHQLIGYTRKYLGPIFQYLVFFSAVLASYAALLAYIIVAGDFLSNTLSSFFYAPLATYSVIFFIVLSLAVLRGLKVISRLELLFSGMFILIVGLFFTNGLSHIQVSNFSGHTSQYAFLPYGVLLFAFGGLLGVPLQRRLLIGQERKLRRAIFYAVGITAVLYALFTVTVVGVSGDVTSPDVVSGLFGLLSPHIILLASIFGICAITTSFVTLAAGLLETYHLDFKVRRFNAWLLVVIPPFLLFLSGMRTFVDAISFAGGVALGIEQVIVVLLYAKAKKHGDRIPEYSLGIPTWILYIIMTIFIAGIGYYLFWR